MLDATTIEELKASLRGALIQPKDEGYEGARKVWNGMIDQKPALIARCQGTADVISAVNFARDNHLHFLVRGGGHNVAGGAICDGGMVIDLSQRMSGVWEVKRVGSDLVTLPLPGGRLLFSWVSSRTGKSIRIRMKISLGPRRFAKIWSALTEVGPI